MGDLAAATKEGSASSLRSFSRRPFAASSSGLAWVGLSIAVGYLLLHAAFDALFLAVWGFPPGELPFW